MCLVGLFHTALFASEPDIVNKTTRVPMSSIHWTEMLKQGKQEVQKLIMEIYRSAVFYSFIDLLL